MKESLAMKANRPTREIRELIEHFQIPQSDALVECLLSIRDDGKSVIDAGIFISAKQSEDFYRDIFHFWVRAFFCFVEDISLGSFFKDIAPFVACKEISPAQFKHAYLDLIDNRTQDSNFAERQRYPQTRVELRNRTFDQCYKILDRPNIKSAVASSEGEYITYFHTVPKGNN
jgi:hypothetical protein